MALTINTGSSSRAPTTAEQQEIRDGISAASVASVTAAQSAADTAQSAADTAQATANSKLSQSQADLRYPRTVNGQAPDGTGNIALAIDTNITSSDITDSTSAGRNLLTAANITDQRTYLGLSAVDNTSDSNKPVSTPQAEAIAQKVSISEMPQRMATGYSEMSQAQRAAMAGISYSVTQPQASDYTWWMDTSENVWYSNGSSWTQV